MDAYPQWVISLVTLLMLIVAIDAGYRLGRVTRKKSEDEKESPISAIVGTILALLAFLMAFMFAIASDRYDARKALVREEAGAIRTAWSRSNFLPEPDHARAKTLLKNYVDSRLAAVQSNNLARVKSVLVDAERIQRELWQMAVVNARKDMNSDVAALYIESLNEMTNIHEQRVSIGLHARIPSGIWFGFYALLLLSMVAVGYHAAIAESRRSWMMLILAFSFTIVISLIGALDRAQSRLLPVPQQPLLAVQAAMNQR